MRNVDRERERERSEVFNERKSAVEHGGEKEQG